MKRTPTANPTIGSKKAPEMKESLQLTAQDLSNIRSFLLNQKSHILNRSHEFRQTQRSVRDRSMDEGDLASSQISENVSLNLLEKDRGLLYQIERALSRISLGTFGQCEACADSIGPKRLAVSPFATLCVACTEDLERSH